ncbi:transcription antitermination factor NusB [Candidatus Gottesmanbacteria bacterium RIFCSPHIGHO2_02_FULL_40_13]|uniref:Transcription antitermination factor NusB n=1 Tax=Candidatus Gottesmanbacteria bacterium RIFCSPHIGHO2_02_FULL_40_13 TaxID=1798384 RepID=A0A1F6A809_9BACT|nr:MAG: transcription antitermination factor NusB [Candidatus Gottesmanbacteria bacterium RIFCSPHIGHO2_02_FULL_40_13]
MKKASDPRHRKRIKLVKALFAESFSSRSAVSANKDFLKIQNNLARIDENIQGSAKQFPLDKIAKIDLAILRLSVYELLIERHEPVKVIIDEAVELAKAYGGEASPMFINGVLGYLLKKNYA